MRTPTQHAINPQKTHLLKVPFSTCSTESLMVSMAHSVETNGRGYICITNTESLYYALKEPPHFEYVQNSDFSCCDGIAVRIAGKMLGVDIPRLHGPDLMASCCRYGIEKGWRHFFYGGKEGIPELLQARMEAQFPGTITAGTYSPPFRPLTPEEDRMIVDRINQACADILWVGLGLPKQEQWIAAHRDRINTPWMIGVGAAFDFHAGTIKRAPQFYRKMGLEWLYRLAFEPRMFVRNFNSLQIFKYIFYEFIKQTRRVKN